jgi:hypothetical protein
MTENWDSTMAHQMAESVLKTKQDMGEHTKKTKELKDQLLHYMKRMDTPLIAVNDVKKTLVAVETPIRFTLEEAVREKFTRDGIQGSKIDEWLNEVKDIRKSGIKGTRQTIKIRKLKGEKGKKEKKETKGDEKETADGKGKGKKRTASALQNKNKSGTKRVKFASSDVQEQKQEAVSIEPNVPMQVLPPVASV